MLKPLVHLFERGQKPAEQASCPSGSQALLSACDACQRGQRDIQQGGQMRYWPWLGGLVMTSVTFAAPFGSPLYKLAWHGYHYGQTRMSRCTGWRKLPGSGISLPVFVPVISGLARLL